MKGHSGWHACNGDHVIGQHRESRDHRMSFQVGKQRHCGEELPHDPSAQGRTQAARAWRSPRKNTFGHNPTTCRKFRNPAEKSTGSRPYITRCFVAQRGESAYACAGVAVLVLIKRVLHLSSRTCITSSGLDSEGRLGKAEGLGGP